jgi:adenylyltransferase/sulfurtransferase
MKKEVKLSGYDKKRYNRQMLIPGFGEGGQKILKSSRVFIAGVGGLGSPVSIYLAVAGVGTIKIADKDVVELSNLNRQILHWDRNIGRKKVESAREKLAEANPRVKIETFDRMIDSGNALELTKNCDLIIDAMDNFPTRYVLNEAAVRNDIPLIHGAVRGLWGQITTIIPKKTACLRCIFEKGPPPEIFPILGATAGVIAMLQATEAVKLLTGVGQLLTNRLLIYDGRTMKFDEIAVKRVKNCSVCGDRKKV